MKKLITSLCALACLTACLCAQNITVTDAIGQSPAAFLKNNLAGGGVYIFNAKFANSASSIKFPNIGTFDANGYDGLMMEKGIIMTTGDISVAVGPNNTSSMSYSLDPFYSDPELAPLATSSVTGCSTIDFDFVCLSDNISFNYCFGSEEYPEYVCSSFNDVFAFFVTGPDPETGEEVTRNIAIIPDSESDDWPDGQPVSVNAVNKGQVGSSGNISNAGCDTSNSAYYYDNSKGDNYGGSYGDTSIVGVQYDGFTMKLAAETRIVPCAVYHMHISVCNVSDNSFDSGVFIEGGSFSAPTQKIGLSTPKVDTVKGSCPFVRTIDLSQASFSSGTVHFTYGGTAVEGVDYVLLDADGNVIGNNAFQLTKDPRPFTIQGLQGADLSVNKTINLYLNTSLCPDFPQLLIQDTQRYVFTRGGDVRVKDTTINASHVCLEVSAPLVYGENVSYRWEPTTGIDNPYARTSTAMITESRTYKLIATGGSGCNSDTATVNVVITGNDPGPVAIEQAEGQPGVSVFPNPAAEVINISAEALQRVEIFTVEGRLVLDREYNGVSGQVAISTDELENGVYGVRVTTANGKSGAKIVVNK